MDDCGFTLLELLITVLIAFVVVAGLGSLFVTSQRVAFSSESQTFLQRQGALIMDEVTQRIRSASVLTRGTCHGADFNSIGVTNTNLPPNNGPYCFYRSGNQLLMDTNAGTWDLLKGTGAALTVTAFTTALVDPLVTISFQLSDNRQNSMTFTTQVTRRNTP